jgi:hypothetical protein
MPRPLKRVLKWLGLGLAGLALLAIIPVLWIETYCAAGARVSSTQYASLLPPADRREEVNSYLTYPEWSIVHAYEDLAAVTRRGSESDYDYFAAVRRFWSSLCSISQMASARGTISGEYKVMLHVIGLSFAAEMGVKGAYEKSIGRVTAWLRGNSRTPEDTFALVLADDYAAFLRQTPWYEFPFGQRLLQFWRETPLVGGNIVRKLERRIALTLEWGTKSIYAKLIAVGAAATPAPLRIKSVIADLIVDDVIADGRIKVLEVRDQATIIETDRYRTLTEIMQGLAARGRNFTEIAGNQNILVTVFAPTTFNTATLPASAVLVFEVPVGARPGWRRLALDVKVPTLTALIRGLETTGLQLEHVYDY